MEFLSLFEPAWIWAFAFGVALVAGLIKGLVGFGMPMILISGLGSVMSPELALAGLILPTLASNGWQALRHGWAEAWRAIQRYKVFLGAGLVLLLSSAQLVRVIPADVMCLLIGFPIVAFAAMGLVGRPLRLRPDPGAGVEAAIGAVAGFFGGISGVWGPPTVAMLTAQETDKHTHVRIQGVIYGLGAVALLGAHIGSGVLRVQTLPLTVFLLVPAMAGMVVGLRIHDRIAQATFRRLTLAVLLLAGLNLIRRGLF